MTVLYCFDTVDSTRSWDNQRSKPPGSLDALLAANDLVLGHVTSSTFLDKIRQDGLVPDFEVME